MDERLILSEIEARYPSEWVLLNNAEFDEHLRVVHGVVVCHSKDRDDIDRKALEIQPRSAASLYIGSIAEEA